MYTYFEYKGTFVITYDERRVVTCVTTESEAIAHCLNLNG